MYINVKNKSFTLAEVLITLLIIGVIASIVIPGLIADSQQAELKTAWKKIYSDINQATKRIRLDNGGTLVGLITIINDNDPTNGVNDKFRNFYTQYLTNFKICPEPVIGPCWNSSVTSFAYDTLTNDNAGIILGNGAFVLFDYVNASCTSNNLCGIIEVDVNGTKGPNKVGKDIFGIKVLENRIMPWGTLGDGYENTCATTGEGCSAKYLYQ
jgi:type II secretory pathway pseudopilin PulG